MKFYIKNVNADELSQLILGTFTGNSSVSYMHTHTHGARNQVTRSITLPLHALSISMSPYAQTCDLLRYVIIHY